MYCAYTLTKKINFAFYKLIKINQEVSANGERVICIPIHFLIK